MPTILDRAIGLSDQRWLAIDYDYDPDQHNSSDTVARHDSVDDATGNASGGPGATISRAMPE